MRIELDAEACVGHGRCYALAPDVFTADEQGHGVVVAAVAAASDVPSALRAQAETAARSCPEEAIRLIDD